MMNKFFLKSKTILGVILAALPTVLPLLGINFGADDATMISEGIDQLVLAAGSVLAVYGRFAAGGVKVSPN